MLTATGSIGPPLIVGEDDFCCEETPDLRPSSHEGNVPAVPARLNGELLMLQDYVKCQGSLLYDYASSKQGNGVSYQRDALPSYTSQYTANPHTHLPHTLAVSSTSAAAASVEVPHGFSLSSGSTLSARDAFYRAQEAAFIAATSLQQAPEVTFYSPSKGLAGGKLFVYARTEVDFITAGRQYSFAIMFGARKCDARLIRIDRQDEHFQYAISAEIPPFSTTGWLDSQVPLYLTIHDDDPGQPLAAVEVGEFTYADLANISGKETIPEPATKKRKFSSCSADYMYSPPRKILTLAGRETSRQIAINSYNIGRGVSPFQSHHSTGHDSAPLSDVDSPLTPVFNGYPLVINPPQSSVIATSDGPSALSHRQALQSPTDIAANPLLVRTSTLGEGLETSHTISPYALFPAKAALMIDGELESMGDGWLADEWNAGRRLVEFRREQSGCSIATTFRAVLAGEWDPNSICVSCIWWEERNECFVTSVDTIYLLESLVSARFSVEEKNRIRRNLEGFRPLTISKSKADSESFFKLIMGFPNPKPRNIEKDVKVFPWRILAHALKKIIGKYSASYSPMPVTSIANFDCGSHLHYPHPQHQQQQQHHSQGFSHSLGRRVEPPPFEGSSVSKAPSDMYLSGTSAPVARVAPSEGIIGPGRLLPPIQQQRQSPSPLSTRSAKTTTTTTAITTETVTTTSAATGSFRGGVVASIEVASPTSIKAPPCRDQQRQRQEQQQQQQRQPQQQQQQQLRRQPGATTRWPAGSYNTGPVDIFAWTAG